MAAFWNLVLLPGKKYKKIVENGIQVTRATLDTSKASTSDALVQVLLEYEGNEMTISNLSMKHGVFQSSLDLTFSAGESIAFSTSGAALPVTLTGVAGSDEDDSGDDSDDEDYMIGDEDSSAMVDSTMEEEEADEFLSAAGKKRKRSLEVASKFTQPCKAAKGADGGRKKKLTLADEDFSTDDSDDDTYNPVADLKDESGLDLLQGDDEDCDETMEDFEDTLSEEEDEDEDEEEDDDDDEEESAEEDMDEEEEPVIESPVKKSKKDKMVNGQAAAKSPVAAKLSKQEKIKEKEVKTPAKEVKTPAKKEGKEQQRKTPKAEKTSPLKLDNKENIEKTPKQDKKKNKEGKTPKGELRTPKGTKLAKSESSPAQKTPKQIRSGGVTVEDVNVGVGPEAKTGSWVSVYYEGRLKSNGKLFDKTTSGPPFKFHLGRGEVIKGWDIGVTGMKVGGKRRIAVPPSMGYGKTGAVPEIPPNSFLNFDITLIGTH